jgi:hypothetical protein
VDASEYGDAYQALQEDAAKSPVVVFVSQDDCDSVAAYRTLCALFAADGARFSAYPVTSYAHLQQLAAQVLPGQQARAPQPLCPLPCAPPFCLGLTPPLRLPLPALPLLLYLRLATSRTAWWSSSTAAARRTCGCC